MRSEERFRPWPLLGGGHAQTVAGHVLRRRLRWTGPEESVVVDVEPGVRLLARASWHDDEHRDRPALMLWHGLEGSDASGYLVSTALAAFREGWNVLRVNLRGCGASLPLCPALYNAGITEDVVAVARWLARRARRIAAVGFSLGANVLLRALGTRDAELPDELVAAVAVAPPLDLDACARALDGPRNRLYRSYFLASLRRSYRERQRLDPARYAPGLERGCRSLREYDDRITARYGGYRDAEDYYRRASSGPVLAAIGRPTLVLAARNDPLIPPEAAEEVPIAPAVRIEMSASGGHVGYVGRARAPGPFWAADRALSFLDPILGARGARQERPRREERRRARVRREPDRAASARQDR